MSATKHLLKGSGCLSSILFFFYLQERAMMKIKVHIVLFFFVCFAIAAFAKFCPPPLHPEACKHDYTYNHCCSQGDCKSYDICCVEPCGNVCRRARDVETSGVAFRNGDECQLGKVTKGFWSNLFG